MNIHRVMSSSLDTPLPLSATIITRWSGLGSSSGTSGWRMRTQAVEGPVPVKCPRTKRHSIACR